MIPEISKVNAVGSGRSISSNILLDLWLVDRLREGFVPPLCGLFGQGQRHFATGSGKNRNEFEYGGKVDAEGRMDCEEALVRHSLLAFFFNRLRKNYCATMETQ
jgi:hypothetical protein